MNKTKKYKLKLDYTADELQELKELSKDYNSPINAIYHIIEMKTGDGLISLWKKYFAMGHEDESDFMADINNVIKGNIVFPKKEYVVHDKATDQYIYYKATQWSLCWDKIEGVRPVTDTKEEWLAINPAYEPML